MKKLRKIHIIILGVVGCVLIGAGLYFALIKDNVKALETETTRYKGLLPPGVGPEVSNYPFAVQGKQKLVDDAKADYVKAVQEVADSRALLDQMMASKMPNLNLGDRTVGMVQLWHEQAEVLGPMLVRWIRSSGVMTSSNFQLSIPAPTTNPNDPTLLAEPITIPLGKISVTGTFGDIMNHLRKWNQFKRLVLVDSPNLSGHSPYLTCEYDATVLIFPRTPAGSPIAIAGGGTSAGLPGAPAPMAPPTPAPPR